MSFRHFGSVRSMRDSPSKPNVDAQNGRSISQTCKAGSSLYDVAKVLTDVLDS
jgi:hypothetical protein